MSFAMNLIPDQPYETKIEIDINGVLKEYTLTFASKIELRSLIEKLHDMMGSSCLTASEFNSFVEELFHSDAYEIVSALPESNMQFVFLSSIAQIMHELYEQDS